MEAVVNAALPIFGLILLGYLSAKRRVLDSAATDSLNSFVVWLALPALLFQAMAQITWQQLNHLGFLGAFGGGMAVTFGLSFILDRLASHRLADASIEGLDAAYANTGFMGIPLSLIAFGEKSLPAAVIATLLTACVLFAFSIVLIELDLQKEHSLPRTVWKVSHSLVRNPLLVAPALGMVFASTGMPLPAPVVRLTSLLGGAASPCALVTIGLFLAQQEQNAPDNRVVARLVFLKLVFQPAVTGLLAFGIFQMPRLWSHSALLLSALPIGTGPFMLAKLYERDAEVTSRAILISTVCSVVTISLLVAWFGRV